MENTYSLDEARSDVCTGCSSNGLLQVVVRLRVVELDGPDSSEVVEVSRELGVAGRLGEGRLGHELVGLVEQVVVEVVSEQEVDEGGLEVLVVAEGGRSVGSEQQSGKGTAGTVSPEFKLRKEARGSRSKLVISTLQLVAPSEVEEDLGRQVVQRSSVQRLNKLYCRDEKLSGLRSKDSRSVSVQ